MKRTAQFIFTVSLTIAFLTSACSQKEPSIKLKEPEFKKYPFKSAVIEYTYSGDASGKMVQYIDYWGAREVQEDKSSFKMMGQERKNNILSIVDQDTVVTIDMDKKEGMKMKNPTWETMIAQFKKMTDEQKKNFANEMTKGVMQQYNAKALGSEDILGRKSDIYEAAGYKLWIWNGLQMKMEVEMNGIKVKMAATKFDTDVDIPDAKFIPPAEAKIQMIGPQGPMGSTPPPQGQTGQTNPNNPNAQQQSTPQSDPHAGMNMKKEEGKGK